MWPAPWVCIIIIPAEIAALDPTQNTSRLRVLNDEIEGPYLPGHLIGDHGFLCVRQFETKGSYLPARKPLGTNLCCALLSSDAVIAWRSSRV